MEEQQIYANPSKCAFGVQEVEYLGHIVCHEGVKVDPNKIKATREWPIPQNWKKLRGLLGLRGYYSGDIYMYKLWTSNREPGGS